MNDMDVYSRCTTQGKSYLEIFTQIQQRICKIAQYIIRSQSPSNSQKYGKITSVSDSFDNYFKLLKMNVLMCTCHIQNVLMKN